MEALRRNGSPYLEYTDETGNTRLHRAVHACSADLVTRLIALGADVNAQNGFGFTPLDVLFVGAGEGFDCHGIMELIEANGGKCNYYR